MTETDCINAIKAAILTLPDFEPQSVVVDDYTFPYQNSATAPYIIIETGDYWNVQLAEVNDFPAPMVWEFQMPVRLVWPYLKKTEQENLATFRDLRSDVLGVLSDLPGVINIRPESRILSFPMLVEESALPERIEQRFIVVYRVYA